MVDKFNNIFFLIVYFAHFIIVGSYAFQLVFDTKKFLKGRGVDKTATLIEKLLLDANIIEKGIDYNNETARTDKVQSRRADILTLCRTTKTYPELEKYIKQEFESFNVTSLFNTDNSELIFDPI